VSAASRSRMAAETPALAVGATILCPGLVLGRRDRWVVPALSELLERVPALWDGGQGRLSVIAVGDLARLVAHLCHTPPRAAIHHASHPEPVRTADLLACLAQHRVLPTVSGTLPWVQLP
ncbi:NAD(P)-dependent oxidoreductase, partial [Streptomyces syringium]